MKRLTCVSLLASLALTVGCAWGAGAPPATVDLQAALSLLTAATDQMVSGQIVALQLLAQTREVQSARWRTMRPLLASLSAKGLPATIWFTNPDGSYYTVEKGLVEQNLRDRTYFGPLLAGEKPFVSELVISKSTGKEVLVVAVPVKRYGKVVGGLGASVRLDELSDRLYAVLPSRSLVFYGIALDCRVAFHAKHERIFADPTTLGSPSLTAAIGRMLKEPAGEATYQFENSTRRVMWQTSPLLGWRVVLGLVE